MFFLHEDCSISVLREQVFIRPSRKPYYSPKGSPHPRLWAQKALICESERNEGPEQSTTFLRKSLCPERLGQDAAEANAMSSQKKRRRLEVRSTHGSAVKAGVSPQCPPTPLRAG